MKAIGYQKSLPIASSEALVLFELPVPEVRGRDLLVKVEAVSVNPVDTKIRRKVSPKENEYKVLGWDAAGIVEAVGEQVELFKPGDKVWYAGSINRSGTNAEYHLVDERIVAEMPKSLDFKQAAAMPLTSITAWELLFDRFGLAQESTGTLLIIGAAGGVGSMMIQLAKRLTQMSVIATASRPETKEWVISLGADHVVDHSKPLQAELMKVGLGSINNIASLTHTGDHFAEIADIIAPQGKIGVIDDPDVLDVMPFKRKSVSIHWEFMFTRSFFETEDILEQHKLLSAIANMVDDGELISTATHDFGEINASNLIRAHALLESGRSKGKIVLAGF